MPPHPAPGHGTVVEARAGKSKIVWRKGRLIGEGAHGKVFLGFDAVSGMFIAAKEFCFEDVPNFEPKVQQLAQEIKIMKDLRHDNIVRYIGADRKGFYFYIFMEYVPGGSVRSILDEFGPFPEDVVRKYVFQILQGLSYLHEQNIVHRDLKAANTLVSVNGKVKLTDFGSAHYFDTAETKEMRGTAHWLAPEVIRGEGATAAADIWGLGCMMIEMVTGGLPFAHIGNGAAVMVHNGDPHTSVELPPDLDVSPPAREFIMACFNKEPRCRPTAVELLQMSFMTDFLPAVPDDIAVMSLNSASEYHHNATPSAVVVNAVAAASAAASPANGGQQTTIGTTISSVYTRHSTIQSSVASSTVDENGAPPRKKSTTSSSGGPMGGTTRGPGTSITEVSTFVAGDLQHSVQSNGTFSSVSMGSWARPTTGGNVSVSTHQSLGVTSVLSDAQQQALINRAMSHVPGAPARSPLAFGRTGSGTTGSSVTGHSATVLPVGAVGVNAGAAAGMAGSGNPLQMPPSSASHHGSAHANDADGVEDVEESVLRIMQQSAVTAQQQGHMDSGDAFVIEVEPDMRINRSNSQVLEAAPSKGLGIPATWLGCLLIVVLCGAVITLVVFMVSK